MRRRFGRGRKKNDDAGDGRGTPIDATQALETLTEANLGEALEAVELDGVPPSRAVLATGSDAGTDLAIGFSPNDGGRRCWPRSRWRDRRKASAVGPSRSPRGGVTGRADGCRCCASPCRSPCVQWPRAASVRK